MFIIYLIRVKFIRGGMYLMSKIKKILITGGFGTIDRAFIKRYQNKFKFYNMSRGEGLQAQLKREFPEDLSSIFPWPNFFESSQEAFLVKEEYIAGAFGLETRYPFLDRDVVQEFLWLKPELKNKHYKSVLHNYLVENSFPFEENTKRGFSV